MVQLDDSRYRIDSALPVTRRRDNLGRSDMFPNTFFFWRTKHKTCAKISRQCRDFLKLLRAFRRVGEQIDITAPHQHFALRAKSGHRPFKGSCCQPFFGLTKNGQMALPKNLSSPFCNAWRMKDSPARVLWYEKTRPFFKRPASKTNHRCWSLAEAETAAKLARNAIFIWLYDIFSSGVRQLGAEIQVHPIGEGGSLWFAGPGWKCDAFREINWFFNLKLRTSKHTARKGSDTLLPAQVFQLRFGSRKLPLRRNPRMGHQPGRSHQRKWLILAAKCTIFYCALISKIRTYTPVI